MVGPVVVVVVVAAAAVMVVEVEPPFRGERISSEGMLGRVRTAGECSLLGGVLECWRMWEETEGTEDADEGLWRSAEEAAAGPGPVDVVEASVFSMWREATGEPG